jgi:predicted metal-dependent hydrolase
MQNQEISVRSLADLPFDKNLDYLFGIDLFNQQYFWESHVYWEALWHKAGRKGETADFLKGLIKMGAAGVKLKMSQEDLAIIHFERALELFQPLLSQTQLHGLEVQRLIEDLKSLIKEPHNLYRVKLKLENVAEVI